MEIEQKGANVTLNGNKLIYQSQLQLSLYRNSKLDVLSKMNLLLFHIMLKQRFIWFRLASDHTQVILPERMACNIEPQCNFLYGSSPVTYLKTLLM